ncbi:MAG: hypothetical protein K2L77_08660, partial [Muribaculaceae bacterium]|nr:hypothetical protein [Muribaculaceae bacterium]
MNLKSLTRIPLALATAIAFTACSDNDDPNPDPNPEPEPEATSGLYVICQGNFGSGNSSITFYDPASNTYTGEV